MPSTFVRCVFEPITAESGFFRDFLFGEAAPQLEKNSTSFYKVFKNYEFDFKIKLSATRLSPVGSPENTNAYLVSPSKKEENESKLKVNNQIKKIRDVKVRQFLRFRFAFF